jgi:lysozyme
MRSKAPYISAGGGALALAIGFLIAKEGLETEAYVDIAGVNTICIGHTGLDVQRGQRATRAICEDLLSADLDPVWAAEDKYIRNVGALPPHTRAAVASFIFNIGVDAFRGSSVLGHLNAGRVTAACDALLRWTKARAGPQGRLVVLRGLINRRVAERRLCLGEAWS